jgi:hypothetical protein
LNDLLGIKNTLGGGAFETDIDLVGIHVLKRTGWANLDTGRVSLALVANNGFAQIAVDKTGTERAGVTAGTAADTFFFTDDTGACLRIAADGIHRADQFAHRRFTLHAGGRDKLVLSVFFGFDGANPRSLRIAFFHISQRAADLAHLASAALFRIDNDYVSHSLTSILKSISKMHLTLNGCVKNQFKMLEY